MAENDSNAADSGQTKSDGEPDQDANASRSAKRLPMQFVTLGTELASYTIAMALVGYMVDSVRQHDKPYASALGTLIGFTFGMYRFIQVVTKNTKR